MNSKQVNETVNKLFSFMQDVKDGDLRTILVNMQKMNDYMAEKLRIYEEHLASLTGKKRPILTESDKRRLGQGSPNPDGIRQTPTGSERQRIERFPACRHRTDMGSRDNPKMVFGSGGSEIQQRQ